MSTLFEPLSSAAWRENSAPRAATKATPAEWAAGRGRSSPIRVRPAAPRPRNPGRLPSTDSCPIQNFDDGDLALIGLAGELCGGPTWLDLSDAAITDQGLRHLDSCSRLEELSLCGTSITDAALPSIAGLKGLRYLSLAETSITSLGLVPLLALRQLEWLDLGGTRIDDAAMPILGLLDSLKELLLYSTNVTDAGLDVLASLQRLEWLDAAGCLVSPSAARSLERRLPLLSIYV